MFTGWWKLQVLRLEEPMASTKCKQQHDTELHNPASCVVLRSLLLLLAHLNLAKSTEEKVNHLLSLVVTNLFVYLNQGKDPSNNKSAYSK